MHKSGWPAVLPSSLEKINMGSGCWAPLFSSEPPLYLCLQHFSQQHWARFTWYSQELGGTPWLLWDYPSLQNKQFFTDTLSGVFPYRCPRVRRGQARRDLTCCVNPLDASCSPPEQCHSLSKTSTGAGAASGKPEGGTISHTSAHSSTLHVCRQLKIGCRRELLITHVSTETQLPYPSFTSS